MKQYQTVSFGYGDEIDDKTLNLYAKDGWRIIAVNWSQGQVHYGIVSVLLERDVETPAAPELPPDKD